jgi:NCAIR mutase (PurE)-related protein
MESPIEGTFIRVLAINDIDFVVKLRIVETLAAVALLDRSTMLRTTIPEVVILLSKNRKDLANFVCVRVLR